MVVVVRVAVSNPDVFAASLTVKSPKMPLIRGRFVGSGGRRRRGRSEGAK